MSLLQAWLMIGVPGLVLGMGLFVVRSPARAMAGYVVLVATFVGMALVDRMSAAVVGGLLALLYAAGRGGDLEREERDDGEGVLPAVVGYKQRRATQES